MKIGFKVVMARTMSFATSLLRALEHLNYLSFMLDSVVLIIMLSIVLYLDDLEEFHEFMLLWSFKFYWNYALMLINFAGFNSEILLKLHFLQQSRKPIFEEMALSSDVVKPEVFDGANFKRWQAKTKLWLTDLRLFWVVSNPPMFPLETAEMTRWEDANNSALARLLAVLSNRLFDVYVTFTNAKQLWDELNEKYSEGDNGNESFITAAYLNYKMVEGRSVMEQLHELQLHVCDLNQYDCLLPESFQVNVILAKLPSS